MIVFATLCKQFCKNDINVQHKVSTTKKYTCRSLISNKKGVSLTENMKKSGHPGHPSPTRGLPRDFVTCHHLTRL